MNDSATNVHPRPRRWRQFSVRALLVLIAVLTPPIAWFGWEMRQARRLEATVSKIEKRAGRVKFAESKSWAGNWARANFGRCFMADVTEVSLSGGETDGIMAELERLKLTNLGLSGAHITDEGLRYVGNDHVEVVGSQLGYNGCWIGAPKTVAKFASVSPGAHASYG